MGEDAIKSSKLVGTFPPMANYMLYMQLQAGRTVHMRCYTCLIMIDSKIQVWLDNLMFSNAVTKLINSMDGGYFNCACSAVQYCESMYHDSLTHYYSNCVT